MTWTLVCDVTKARGLESDSVFLPIVLTFNTWLLRKLDFLITQQMFSSLLFKWISHVTTLITSESLRIFMMVLVSFTRTFLEAGTSTMLETASSQTITVTASAWSNWDCKFKAASLKIIWVQVSVTIRWLVLTSNVNWLVGSSLRQISLQPTLFTR